MTTRRRAAPRPSDRDRYTTIAALAAAFVLAVLFGGCGRTVVRPPGPPVFYPSLPEEPRLQFLTAISGEEDLGGDSAFADFVAGKEEESRTLRKPYGAAIYGNRIYVADTGLGRIVVVNLEDGVFEEFAGDAGPGRVQVPINITITEDGHKFVADTKREAVLEYGPSDEFVRVIGQAGQFRPSDVAIYGDRMYVCDVRDHEVEVLDRKTGAPLATIGGPGSGDGQLVFPTNLAVDGEGNLYVTDTGNFRVQKFSPDGELQGTFGGIGDTFGTFTRPKGLAVDPEGRVYVADAAFENVQLFDDQYRLLLAFGGPGGEPGNLWLPADVEITTEAMDWFAPYADPAFELRYLVLVVSQYGPRRLNVFGFGDWKGALPPPGAEEPAADAPAEKPADAEAETPGSEKPAGHPTVAPEEPAGHPTVAPEEPAGHPTVAPDEPAPSPQPDRQEP